MVYVFSRGGADQVLRKLLSDNELRIMTPSRVRVSQTWEWSPRRCWKSDHRTL